MRRPFAVIGFTVFVTLLSLHTLMGNTAQIVLALCAAALAVCVAVPRLRREPVLLSSLLACAAACILFLASMYTQFLPVRALDGTSPVLSAHLSDLPRESGSKTVYALETDTVDDVPVRCKVTLLCDTPLDVQPSDQLIFSAKLYASDKPESGAWLRAYDPTDLVLCAGPQTLLSRMLAVRRYVTDVLAQTLPGTPGAVLTAMLLGDSEKIPSDVYAGMRRSGILHIFSVSGLHLSVFAMLLLRLAERKHVPRQVYVPVCAALVLLVMAMTGFPLSCLRAGIMVLLMLVGRWLSRRADALNSLGFSLLILCMTDPFSAGDVGLQLSVLGTLGAVCGMPQIEQWTAHIRIPLHRLQSAIRSTVSTMLLSACITFLSLPVTAAAFQSVSVVAPLTNACMLAPAEWAMTLAAFALPFTLWHPLLFMTKPLLFTAGLLARYCTAVSSLFGSLPFASLQIGKASELLCIAGILLLIAAAIVLRIPLRRKIAMCTAMSVLLLSASFALHTWTAYNVAEISALDFGNGTAVLIQSGGKTALIGCGGTRTAYAVSEETDRLDLLLLPRMAKTEAQNALDVLHAVPTRTVVVPERDTQTNPLFFFFDPQVFSGEIYRVGDVSIEFLSLSASSAVRLQMYGRSMLLLFSPGCDLSRLPKDWLDADMLYARSDVPPGLHAENYALVLLQGEERHVSLVSQEINARGGNAVIEQTVRVQKDGHLGRKAGVCGAGDHRTGIETAIAAEGFLDAVYPVRRGSVSEILLCRTHLYTRRGQCAAGL